MDGIRFQNSSMISGAGGQREINRSSDRGGEFSAVGVGSNSPSSSTSNAKGASFADTLKQAIGNVNELQKSADDEMQKLATGQSQNLHETMIAAEKADIALKLMVQVRNKIIDAYHEVMKMQV